MTIKLLTSIGIVIASAMSCVLATPGRPVAELRHFYLPTDYTFGRMELRLKISPNGHGKDAGIARGNFSVLVPADQLLVLEINPHVLEDPSKIQKCPTRGIDRIRVVYMSLDESHHSVCDAALKILPKFENPIQLECNGSDVTDEGLRQFKSLEKVTVISCFGSDVQGSFLKQWQRLQSLETLVLFSNPVQKENLQFLKNLKKLTNLNIRAINLSDASLKNIAECRGLTELELSKNRRLTDEGLKILSSCSEISSLSLNGDKVTDKSIQTFLKLSHLRHLSIVDTQITAAALLPLKILPIKYLTLPSQYRVADLLKLERFFPDATIRINNLKVTEDEKVQFGPMK